MYLSNIVLSSVFFIITEQTTFNKSNKAITDMRLYSIAYNTEIVLYEQNKIQCSDFIGVSYGVVISFVQCFISLCFSSRFLVFTAILIHENAPLDLTLVKITEILTIVNGENSFKGYRLLTDIFNGKNR